MVVKNGSLHRDKMIINEESNLFKILRKIMDLARYFSDAQEEVNENFFAYDGYDDDVEEDDYDFVDDDDDYEGFDEEDDAFDMAIGRRGSAPTSQPYIVLIHNTSTASGGNTPATILGAYNTLASSSPNWQNGAQISITMGISGITYSEFLYQSMNKPFVVGLTYYQSATVNQVLETMTLIQRDVNGNQTNKTLVPTIDPYQYQSTIIAVKFSYKIDGFTSLVISSVLGNAVTGGTVKLYFYPAENVSTARSLTGRRAVRGYGNPNIVKKDKLSLSSRSLRALSGRRRRR